VVQSRSSRGVVRILKICHCCSVAGESEQVVGVIGNEHQVAKKICVMFANAKEETAQTEKHGESEVIGYMTGPSFIFVPSMKTVRRLVPF